MADVATDGYAVLRSVVTDGAVGSLRARVEQAVAQRAAGVEVRSGTVWITDARTLGVEVEALVLTAPVVEAVAELLGPGPVWFSSVMRNPVGETAQQALHVDWGGPTPPGADQQAQAMFFLDDVGGDNGPTRLVPGSHRWYAVPPKSLAASPLSRHPDEVSVTGSAGDVLVFSSHLWHSGTANRSGRPRRVITATFRRA